MLKIPSKYENDYSYLCIDEDGRGNHIFSIVNDSFGSEYEVLLDYEDLNILKRYIGSVMIGTLNID